MRIAVVGCVHGQLTKAYNAIKAAGRPDCVIMCGDIQACRHPADMDSMSIPPKYRQMGDFHEYYEGKREAPFLTFVIGGNHEASAYMTSLWQGGWLAPNIWYMGDQSVISVDGVRIAGLSGIWYEPDFDKPRFEPELFAKDLHTACNSDARFSAYHIRRSAVNALLSIGNVDVMVTHDWPRGIEQYGDTAGLLKHKPWFRAEVEQNQLGNPATVPLLKSLKAQYWFSAHLHVYFTAKFKKTRFVALDKVQKIRFLKFVDVKPKRHGKNDDVLEFSTTPIVSVFKNENSSKVP